MMRILAMGLCLLSVNLWLYLLSVFVCHVSNWLSLAERKKRSLKLVVAPVTFLKEIWMSQCAESELHIFLRQTVHFAFISFVLRRSSKELLYNTAYVLGACGKDFYDTLPVHKQCGKVEGKKSPHAATNMWEMQCDQIRSDPSWSDQIRSNQSLSIHAFGECHEWTMWRKKRYMHLVSSIMYNPSVFASFIAALAPRAANLRAAKTSAL